MTTAPRPVLLSLLGPSDSGKTTLAGRLVAHWSSKGLRVGYVKHASHGFEMDRPGKDTARIAEAGGIGVAVTGPQGTAYLDSRPVEDPRVLAGRFFPDCDVVVFEGFRTSAVAAVVLVGEADEAAYLDVAKGPILAVVAPQASRSAAAARARGATCFDVSAVDALLAHLERELGV